MIILAACFLFAGDTAKLRVMFNIIDLDLSLGGRVLLQRACARIAVGARLGLIGVNGSGKSSLLRLLAGQLSTDGGEIQLPSGARVAYAHQQISSPERVVLEYVLDGDHAYRQLRDELDSVPESGSRHAHLLHELELIDGYSAPARASKLLFGLGFNTAQLLVPLRSLSGGWQMRANLAQAMMTPSDLLLLDEPTNHLDLNAVMWLEQWAKGYPGTLVVIAHDALFLDNVCDHILHIDRARLYYYRGNYTAFLQQRAATERQAQASAIKVERKRLHLQQFVDRFRAQATKAKQAQSRLKMLQRLETIDVATPMASYQFNFREPLQRPHPLLKWHGVDLGYTTPILRQVNLVLGSESRIGLIGANGAGKSTLIKALAGELKILAGESVLAQGLRVGYFSQHQFDSLHSDQSALWHLRQIDPQATEQTLRDYLGGYGFLGDQALDPIRPFSGGEKARLCLARIIWMRPNLLLLDEPTNHLDLDSRQALSVALQHYLGALVVVSHDRLLLAACCDELLLVDHGGVTLFAGDLEDYRTQTLRRVSHAEQGGKSSADGLRKQQKRAEAEHRRQRAPLRREIERLEALSEQQQRTLKQIDQALAAPDLYLTGQSERLAALGKQRQRLLTALEQTETCWLVQQESLERMLEQQRQGCASC